MLAMLVPMFFAGVHEIVLNGSNSLAIAFQYFKDIVHAILL